MALLMQLKYFNVGLKKGPVLNNNETSFLFSVEGRMMSVTPEPDTIVIISRVTHEPDCSVCVDEPPNQLCKPDVLTLRDPRNTSIEFTCPQPQDVFHVEINREIGMNVCPLTFDLHKRHLKFMFINPHQSL